VHRACKLRLMQREMLGEQTNKHCITKQSNNKLLP
jgi:hypothetical protein